MILKYKFQKIEKNKNNFLDYIFLIKLKYLYAYDINIYILLYFEKK